MLIFGCLYYSNNPERNSATVLNIDNNNKNVSWTANQHIIMISEGLCDTENWSNDPKNLALINIKYIQIQSSYFK